MTVQLADGKITLAGIAANGSAKAQKSNKTVNKFNAEYAVGDSVIVKDDYGKEFTDTIVAEASIVCNNLPVAWLKNKGCYFMERVIRKA